MNVLQWIFCHVHPPQKDFDKTFITGHRRQVKTVYGFADCLGGEDDIKSDNTSEEDITGRECPYHVLSLAEDVVHQNANVIKTRIS